MDSSNSTGSDNEDVIPIANRISEIDMTELLDVDESKYLAQFDYEPLREPLSKEEKRRRKETRRKMHEPQTTGWRLDLNTGKYMSVNLMNNYIRFNKQK